MGQFYSSVYFFNFFDRTNTKCLVLLLSLCSVGCMMNLQLAMQSTALKAAIHDSQSIFYMKRTEFVLLCTEDKCNYPALQKVWKSTLNIRHNCEHLYRGEDSVK